ncbi:MAG: ankyrin repeat domain-containing protein [Thermodesulfobacteriota bacterium]
MGGDELMQAAMAGKLEQVRELVARGIDINFVNRSGVSALMVACQWNQTQVVRFLLENGADVELRERGSGHDALMYSCFSGNPDLVELVLRHGATIDATDAMGRSALMIAASVGKAETVKVLLRTGANADLRDHSGATALDWARESGHRALADLFPAKGRRKGR